MTILYEYRPQIVRTTKPKLLQKKGLIGKTGFVSIFGFPHTTAKYIESTKATRGLSDYPLYIDLLYLDFDDAERSYQTALLKLDSMKVRYAAYTTGNRGYHVHIPITGVCGTNLPIKIKYYMNTLFPGADNDIYKGSGIIRLTGTKHIKTGRHKKVLRVKDGPILTLPEELSDSIPYAPKYNQKETNSNLIKLLTTYPTTGGRNKHAYMIAITCSNLGISMDTCKEFLDTWAEMLPKSLDRSDYLGVLNTMRSAYRS